MSLATLKKKTQTKYNNMSVHSKHGFSLNGTTRNQGFVGQTMLSRSLPRTLFKGTVPRGHGGCCGTFPIQHTVQSGIQYWNDSFIAKQSVLSNKGMMETKFMCHDQQCNHVKPDNNHNNNTQDQYIRLLASQTIDISGCHMNKSIHSFKGIHLNPVSSVTDESKLLPECRQKCQLDSNPAKTRYFTQSDRIQLLQNECAKNNPKFIPKTNLGTSFGC